MERAPRTHHEDIWWSWITAPSFLNLGNERTFVDSSTVRPLYSEESVPITRVWTLQMEENSMSPICHRSRNHQYSSTHPGNTPTIFSQKPSLYVHLSRLNSLHNVTVYIPNIDFNIVGSSTLTSPKRTLGISESILNTFLNFSVFDKWLPSHVLPFLILSR